MMTEDEKVFSIGVLAYNNYRYIKETIDSILCQNYASIELIVSNDGSSDFEEEDLRKYIEDNKKENLIRFVINNNPHNIGTVKNIELIRKLSTGDYFLYIAADDALYADDVLTRYVEEFEKRPDIQVLSCKMAMCGMILNQIQDYMPSGKAYEIAKQENPDLAFSFESHTCIYAAACTCYKKGILDKMNGYDESYFIIEDATTFIRLARNKVAIGWIDDMIGARHRDGGISHGNKEGISLAYQHYRFDEIAFYCKEVLPYIERVRPEDMPMLQQKWDYIWKEYARVFGNRKEYNILGDWKINGKLKKLYAKVVAPMKHLLYSRTFLGLIALQIMANIIFGILKPGENFFWGPEWTVIFLLLLGLALCTVTKMVLMIDNKIVQRKELAYEGHYFSFVRPNSTQLVKVNCKGVVVEYHD